LTVEVPTTVPAVTADEPLFTVVPVFAVVRVRLPPETDPEPAVVGEAIPLIDGFGMAFMVGVETLATLGVPTAVTPVGLLKDVLPALVAVPPLALVVPGAVMRDVPPTLPLLPVGATAPPVLENDPPTTPGLPDAPLVLLLTPVLPGVVCATAHEDATAKIAASTFDWMLV
jgi:hypothetical protein